MHGRLGLERPIEGLSGQQVLAMTRAHEAPLECRGRRGPGQPFSLKNNAMRSFRKSLQWPAALLVRRSVQLSNSNLWSIDIDN